MIIFGVYTLESLTSFGDISNDARANPFRQRNLTDGSAIGIEVFFAVHVGAKVNAGVADGTVAAHAEVLSANTFGVGDTQWNIVQPLRGLNAEGHGHIDHFRFFHRLEEIFFAHSSPGLSRQTTRDQAVSTSMKGIGMIWIQARLFFSLSISPTMHSPSTRWLLGMVMWVSS